MDTKEDIEFFLFHLVSEIRGQAEMVASENYNPQMDPKIHEGMKIAFHFTLDGIISLAKINKVPLVKLGLDDFDPMTLLKQ